jgi:anti-anti-sigma factor
LGRDPAWLLGQKAGPVLDIDVGSTARTGYVVVALRGELDTTNAAGTARILTAAITPQLRIIVDLADVTFIDSKSVRELMSARAQAQQAGGALLLARPQPTVRRLLSLLDLIGLFPVFASVEEAITGCQEPSCWLDLRPC